MPFRLGRILKNLSPEDKAFQSSMTSIIGYKTRNIDLFRKSFTHRSLNKVNDQGNQISYERLEFLGDAVLGTIIAHHLFKEVPEGNEGYLTKMRSKIVSREHLNELGKDLGLINHVQSNVSPDKFGDNVHGNIFEALVGAIYLDKGFTQCVRFIFRNVIDPYVDISRLEGKIVSYKSLLIEWCQQQKVPFKFEIYEDTGNDSVRHFSVNLDLRGKRVSKGRGTSKKKAEEQAAKRAYFALQDEIDRDRAAR